MRAILWVSTLALLATSLAGCVGQFEVKQTEPIRIQIDGEPQETRVAASDSGGGGDGQATDKSEFRIEKDADVDVVKVVVQVVNVEEEEDDDDTGDNETSRPAVIMVIVEDRDTNERIAERRVEADQDAAQVELNVDVKGKDNVVIVTQAVQGVADVDVAAKGSTTSEGGSTMSPSPTTNTTSPPPTTTNTTSR